jgi:hypothetical protein
MEFSCLFVGSFGWLVACFVSLKSVKTHSFILCIMPLRRNQLRDAKLSEQYTAFTLDSHPEEVGSSFPINPHTHLATFTLSSTAYRSLS